MASDETEFTIEVRAIVMPCPRCGGPPVEQRVRRTAYCPACEAGLDEFDREARDLLSDNGTRSWAQVEIDVARALRNRALKPR
jgi:hypothetical protein